MTNNKRIKPFTAVATLASQWSPSSPVIMGGGLDKCVKMAGNHGYEALELHWADPKAIPLKEIDGLCLKSELKIAAFATGRAYVQEGLSLISKDPQLRARAIDRLKSFVDAAAPYEATVILGCIRGNLSAGEEEESALEILANSTKEVALYGKEKGVGLVFEAINRYENNYLNTAKETVSFIRKYDLPNTKLLLDTFHMNIEEVNFAQAIIDSKDYLGYVHIADSNRHYPGAGHIPLKEILDALKQVDYNGCISAECLPLPNPEKALEGFMEGITKALG